MKNKIFDLLQPRHIYSGSTGLGHVYMPTSLLTTGSRLLQAGYEVSLFDENIRPYIGTAQNLGINLLGSPYVPVVKDRLHTLSQQNIFLGGQVVNGLTSNQRQQLFGSVYNGNDDEILKSVLGIESLPSPYKTSLIPMYERIPDQDMKKYLEKEFSFFVSQGCKFACKFCAAIRTQKDALGTVTKVTEVYRDFDIMEQDLSYLLGRARTLGVSHIDIYMSNLDVFQSPVQLGKFADTVIKVRSNIPEIQVTLRALATIDSFLNCAEKHPDVITKLVQAGYTTTGFGIDGGAPEVWRKVGKAHNFSSKDSDPAKKSIEALRISKEVFGITPEILMVFGHPDVDTVDSMQSAVDFTHAMVDLYGAVPRPHIAKNLIPGNDHWMNPANQAEVQMFIQEPWLFQALDFCALATEYTHGNKDFAKLVNKYYLAICNIEGNTTQPIYPIELTNKQVTLSGIQNMLAMNLNRFDR
ncbi:hypothetical protein KC866_01410 [Patescibacteria group bacterium]|nr:hypothetical protein [Patescibacteria group bacterium]